MTWKFPAIFPGPQLLMEITGLKFGTQLRNILVSYIVATYTIDYGSTIYGTSIGMREAGGLMSALMSEFGRFAIPLAALVIALIFFGIVASYKKSPRYVTALLLMIAVSETFVVTSNLISIHNQLANLSQLPAA